MRKILEPASWIAGIASLAWAVWTYYRPTPAPAATPAPLGAASTQIIAETEGMPDDLIQRLVPALQSPMSLRNAEKYLGTPIEETIQERVYERFGLRITLFGISADKSYFGIEVGPAAENPRIEPINFSGPWGKLSGRFGEITLSSVDKAIGCHKISDFNHGANASCMNVFEVECGGAQYQSNYFIRAGVLQACKYKEYGAKYLDPDSIVTSYRTFANLPVGAPTPSISQLIDEEYLTLFKVPLVANARINFFTIATRERTEPRAAGGR